MGKRPGDNRPTGQRQKGARAKMIWRLIKYLLILAVLAAIGLVIYAYAGPIFFPADFAAPTQDIVAPVTLEVD